MLNSKVSGGLVDDFDFMDELAAISNKIGINTFGGKKKPL